MTKVAPPAFDVGNDASQWLIFVGSTTTTPLGQVKTFEWTQEVTADETVRVSDSATYYTDKAVTVTGPLELCPDNDNAETISVGGQLLTAGDATYTLMAVFYAAEATSGTAVKTYTFTGFRISSITAGPREGQSASYWAYDWRATLLAAT